LKQLWADPAVTQVETARQLGVDRTTIVRQAILLDLPFPPPGSTIKKPESPETQEMYRAKLQKHRAQWLTIVANHPDADRTTLRQIQPRVHNWLRSYDKEWLLAHMPPRKKPIHSRTKLPPSRVNWEERDVQLAQAVRTAAQELRNRPGRPIRISKEALGREVGQVIRS